MVKLNQSIDVQQPANEVFEYITTFEKRPQYLGLIEAEQISEGPVKTGTRFREVLEAMGQTELVCEVTAYEPNRTLAYKTLSGPIDGTFTWHFEPQGNGTHIALSAEVALRGMMKYLTPLLVPVLRRQAAKDADSLRQVFENRPFIIHHGGAGAESDLMT